MTRSITVLMSAAAVLLASCERPDADGPPTVNLGDSTCVACGMIISDQRFATATIVEGPRGAEPLLFDDFNCQARYERRDGLVILNRWSHDYNNSQWLPTARAYFLMSPDLRTPMASRTAAFATRDEAEQARESLGGEALTFQQAWPRLAPGGVR